MGERALRRSRTRPTRVVVAALAVTALAAGCADSSGSTEDSGAPAAEPTGPTAPSLGAAHWLAEELNDGLLEAAHGPDIGLSIDAAIALAHVPGHADDVRAVADAVAARLPSYTTGADFDSDDVYAGSVAKAAVLAQVAGQDPRAFGGTDLIARLEGLVGDDGPSTGRLADDVRSPDGRDYANGVGQAYAVRALVEAGSAEAGAATAYLLDQQCSGGWFRLYFAPADARDQTCDGGTAEQAAPDTDVTALALVSLPGTDPEVRAPADAALDWLAQTQGEDGGFGGATSTEGENANSTGLAGWALMAAGREAEAQRAAEWLADRQVTDLACDADGAGADTGAVAYDDAVRDQGAAGLDEPGIRDQWRRATAQAVPVLALAGRPTAEVRVVLDGSTAEVTGLADGEVACLSGPDGFATALEGTGGPVQVDLGDLDVEPTADTLVLRRLAGVVPVLPAS